MSSIVQQRRLAILNNERDAKTESKRSVSPSLGLKSREKDCISPGKDSYKSERRGSNSPLVSRYQPGVKHDTGSSIKDSGNTRSDVGNSPNREHGNKIKVLENKSPNQSSNLGRNQSGAGVTDPKLRSRVSPEPKSTAHDKSYNSKLEKNVKNCQTGKDKEHIKKTKAEAHKPHETPKHDNSTPEKKEKEKTPEKRQPLKMPDKQTRFAMRKNRRAKRHRSDGYVLGLEMAANSSEDEGIPADPTLGDAINFLQWIRNPTLQNLAKLRRAIKTNDKDWMIEFLEFDGLGLLFQCLKDLTNMQGFHLSDMVLKMECTMCIREVVNSQTGLDCLLRIKGKKDNIFGRRFAAGNACAIRFGPKIITPF